MPFCSDTKHGKDPGGVMRRDPSPLAQKPGNAGSPSISEQWFSIRGDALIAILRNKVIDARRRDRRRDQYLADVDPAVEGNGGDII